MIPILRACADPRYKRVVVIMARQMGKTFGIDLNFIGHRLDDDPCHMIVVFPTQKAAESQFEPRLMAMLRSVPSLWEKTAQGQKNKKTAKLIGGVTIRLAWAGSSAELASQEAGAVVIDEYDRMMGVQREGDVLEIIEAAMSTYADPKSLVTTTPTTGTVQVKAHPVTGIEHFEVSEPEEIQSPTWKVWQEGTRFELACPCPHCGLYFVPRLRRLKWPEKATLTVVKAEAALECPGCLMLVGDEHRPMLLERAQFLAPGQTVVDGVVVGVEPDAEDASFWVSGLFSPFRSFGQRARSYVAAARSGDHGRIQAVLNTQFGELYSIAGEAVPWESLRALKRSYLSDTVPMPVRCLTMGVDKQHDRLYYEIRGWGVGLQSWQITCGELIGDTRYDDVWRDLDVLRGSLFDDVFPIAMTVIDSGDVPDPVYAYVRRSPQRCRASKGYAYREKPLDPHAIDVTIGGRKFVQGVTLWRLNSDYWKSFVYDRFPREGDTRESTWHLPQDVPDAYLQQLSGEARRFRASGRTEWKKLRANHFLDCAALSVAAAYMLQVHRWTEQTAPRPPDRTPLDQRAAQQPAGGSRPVRFRYGTS